MCQGHHSIMLNLRGSTCLHSYGLQITTCFVSGDLAVAVPFGARWHRAYTALPAHHGSCPMVPSTEHQDTHACLCHLTHSAHGRGTLCAKTIPVMLKLRGSIITSPTHEFRKPMSSRLTACANLCLGVRACKCSTAAIYEGQQHHGAQAPQRASLLLPPPSGAQIVGNGVESDGASGVPVQEFTVQYAL